MMMEKMGFVITYSSFPYGLLNPPAAGQEKNLRKNYSIRIVDPIIIIELLIVIYLYYSLM